MTHAEREALIVRYERGPALVRAALAEVPAEALQWRPAPGKWSVHEVVVHCADSETTSSQRIRRLIGDDMPLIQGYDQDAWAVRLDYHAQSLPLAMAQVEAVRAWTTAFIRGLPEAAWARAGRHTEMGDAPYTAELWLELYAEHLEVHDRQIRRNLAAWHAR